MYAMPENMRSMLLHTRFATQGKPAFPENNHPVKSGNIYVVHNGHISNDDEIFRDTGALRWGRVDSEAIPAAIAEVGWENATKGLEKLKGSFAIAALSQEHPNDLLLAKGENSPLVVAVRDNFIMWASTLAAICYAWKECIGTVPSSKNVKWLGTGDFLRVTDGKLELGEFEVQRSWTYSSNYAGNYVGSWRSGSVGSDYMNSPTTYWRNGIKYEYDPLTYTERVVDRASSCSTDENGEPCYDGYFEYTDIGGTPVEGMCCFECGMNKNCTLNKVSRDTYLCEDCLDFLTDVSAGEPWREELDLAQRVDGEDDERETSTALVVPQVTIHASIDDLVRCPDCFECFLPEDMVRDGSEMVCKACKETVVSLGMADNFGVSWRTND